jgi:hypothetical protein
MILIIIIDILLVAGLVGITITKGLERALPFFAFVVVLVPLESVIPLPGFFNLSTQRIALCTLLVLYLVFGGGPKEAALSKSTPLMGLLVVHILWCILSTANSVVPEISLKKMLSDVIEYYLMYYILFKTISKVDTIHRILGAMVSAVFVASVVGSVEAYTGWKVAQYFPEMTHYFNVGPSELGRGNRIVSTFGNYSLFGSALAFAIIEAFYLLTLARSAGRKVLLWVAVLLMFVNIYKTISRGPWLALILGFVLLFVYSQLKTRKAILVICLLTALVMVIRPGVYGTIKAIYVGTFDTDDPNNQLGSSYGYRYALWDVAEKALAKSTERQIWGYGIESWFYLDLKAPFGTNPEYPFLSCDNAWVQLTAETGYVGLVLIALLLFTPALMALRDVLKIPKPDNYLSWVLLINMAQYYFMMTNLAIYGWGQTGYMLWMWIAMAMVLRPIKQTEAVEVHSYELRSIIPQEQLVGAPQY